jgi:hypothetical protein
VRAVVDHNRRLAEERFSLERVAAQLLDLLDGAGWLP